jgi:hypothetical protein
MKSPEILPHSDFTKLERKFKLLYFLYDIGIESALEPAQLIWDKYIHIQSQQAVVEYDFY